MMIPPTTVQAQALKVIRELSQDGVPPTVREIAEALGYSRPAAAHGLLVAMKARGLLTWEPRQARTIRIPESTVTRPDLGRLSDEQLKRIASWCHSILADREAGAPA